MAESIRDLAAPKRLRACPKRFPAETFYNSCRPKRLRAETFEDLGDPKRVLP
ncbi:MAG TPA: hypothetical protein VK400_08665 [Pyrinomonadaceae bacterium]|nr:hypothetical protein [Pyrinomonadaceae bacterium]